MNSDSKLTILLLLKDNAPFTWRWMRYANQTKFPFPVLIADGGSDDQVAMGLKDKSLFPNVNYEYVHYPHDKTLVEYRAKLVDAFSRIKTPFAVRSSNDDFYTVGGLQAAVEFLKTHPNYSVARGEITKFKINSKDHVYGTAQAVGDFYQYPSNEEASALERIRKHFEFIHGLWFDVSRTKDLLEAYQEVNRVALVDERFDEQLVDALITAKGKAHRSPGLYALYQVNPLGEGSRFSRKYPTPFDWLINESWPQQFEKFAGSLASSIAKIDGMPESEARNRVIQYYLAYVIGKRNIGDYIERQTNRRLSVKKLIVKRIRDKLWPPEPKFTDQQSLIPYLEFLKIKKD